MAQGLVGQLPPGLAGWVAADQLRQQQQAGQLQQAQGLLGLQAGMADAAEKERVRGLMAQFPEVMATGDEKQIVGLLGQISPQVAAQYVLQKADSKVVGGATNVKTPAGPRVAFHDSRGKVIVTEHEPYDTGGHGTQMERALGTLSTLQQRVDAGETLTPTEIMSAQTARAILQQPRMNFDPATNNVVWSQGLQIPPNFTVGSAPPVRPGAVPALPGGAPGAPAPQGQPGVLQPGQPLPMPTPGTGRKPLDAGTEKIFRDAGGGLAQIARLEKDFKDDYGGFLSETVGRGAIELGRRGGEGEVAKALGTAKHKPLADWWQAYEQWVTDVRAAKFGMTLTGYELQQFNRYRSNPGDSPETIKTNMERQREVLKEAVARELKAVNVSGQNAAQAAALAGVPLAGERTPATTTLAAERKMPSAKAIQRLRMNPRERPQFEAIFGPGSADQYLPARR